MTLRYARKTEVIDGYLFRLFVLGTDCEDQFVGERYYGVCGNLIYVYDALSDSWAPLAQDKPADGRKRAENSFLQKQLDFSPKECAGGGSFAQWNVVAENGASLHCNTVFGTFDFGNSSLFLCGFLAQKVFSKHVAAEEFCV